MLAIAGGKGGSGKTTTALGFARALVAAGERPVVVDADCDMPNLHTMADVDRTPGVGTLAEGGSLDSVVHRSTTVPGVDLVPAGRATGRLEQRALRRLRWASGRVVVDCPAGASDAVAGPLSAAGAALVVSTPERTSLVDAAKTARMASALDTRVPGVVLTRATREPCSRGDDPLRAECDVLVEIPESDRGTGAVLADPAVRSSYERLAERLYERNI